MSIVNKIIGSREEKREYKAIKSRAKKLPKSYVNAYDAMGKYLNVCGGLTSWDDFKRVYTCILDLLEEGASYNIKVSDLVGDDASVFCDDLVRNSKTWKDKYRKRLNKKIKKL